MSDDIASQVARLNSIVQRIPDLINYAKVLQESHQGLREELSDILGNTPLTVDLRSHVGFADKMIADYGEWMGQLMTRLSEVSSQVQSAGGGGSIFG